LVFLALKSAEGIKIRFAFWLVKRQQCAKRFPEHKNAPGKSALKSETDKSCLVSDIVSVICCLGLNSLVVLCVSDQRILYATVKFHFSTPPGARHQSLIRAGMPILIDLRDGHIIFHPGAALPIICTICF